MIIRAAVDVAAPAAAVWDAAMDWTTQSRWMPLTTVEVVSGDGSSVATRVEARTGLGRLAAADPMVVEVWQPPERCEVRHEGRVVRGRGVFIVEPLSSGRSRFIWEEHLPTGGWYGAVARLSGPLNHAFFTLAVRRFARWVESGAPR